MHGKAPRAGGPASGPASGPQTTIRASWLSSPIHPAFFGLYPAIALYAANLSEIPPGELLRPVMIVLLASVILTLILRAVSANWEFAALLASASIILFFAYGHMYLILKTISLGDVVLGRHRYMVPVWGMLLAIVFWFAWGRRGELSNLTRGLNLVGAALILLPGLTVLSNALSPRGAMDSSSPGIGAASIPRPRLDEQRPDIYYIILDGYGRQDILADIYGVDNSGFLGFLEGLGYYIADSSQSNYNQTSLSLASSLNMSYLQTLNRELGIPLNDPAMGRLIEQNSVMQLFHSAGYQTVAFNSGWMTSSLQEADIYLDLSPSEGFEEVRQTTWGINTLEGLLLETSLARLLIDGPSSVLNEARDNLLEGPYWRHRQTILHGLSQLQAIPSWEGDYLVFAHLIVPHPPFVFGPDGEWIDHSVPFSLQDGDKLTSRISRQQYIDRYREQLLYLNVLLEATLGRIHADSEVPPVVLIQADHGPGSGLVWDSPATSDVLERTAILNALYIPCEAERLLYPDLSPVNSFRIVLNACFEADLPLLEDQTYISTLQRRFDFIQVGEQG